MARLVAQRPELLAESRPAAPLLTEWGLTPGLLAAIFDRLGELIAATTAAAGGKAPKVRPFPRPQTALARVRRAADEAELNDLISKVRIAGEG